MNFVLTLQLTFLRGVFFFPSIFCEAVYVSTMTNKVVHTVRLGWMNKIWVLTGLAALVPEKLLSYRSSLFIEELRFEL